MPSLGWPADDPGYNPRTLFIPPLFFKQAKVGGSAARCGRCAALCTPPEAVHHTPAPPQMSPRCPPHRPPPRPPGARPHPALQISEAQQQWWKFKSANFDSVLLFKVGKFYEVSPSVSLSLSVGHSDPMQRTPGCTVMAVQSWGFVGVGAALPLRL